MPDHREIYDQHAHQYELLVSREDYQHNIFRTLNQIRALDGLDVVELGAGTGRLTCMLASAARSIHAFDASQHMLEVAAAKLEKGGHPNWWVGAADHRHLPIKDCVADLVISAWSICYLVVWHEGAWRVEVRRALREMKRALRPGGTVIILETLGTGYKRPQVSDNLAAYYAFLEADNFASTWIRTDYQFESLAEAEALTHFFFGRELARKVIERNWVVLPECTGIWWLKAT